MPDVRETLLEICALQPKYDYRNTAEMKARHRLIVDVLPSQLREIEGAIIAALEPYGSDLRIEGSDGKGNKSELPWVRFCSSSMSPGPRHGYYGVIHFSTDGSAVHITIGCGSATFVNGAFIALPDIEIDDKTNWGRMIINTHFGNLSPFDDDPDFGAKRRLPRSFQRATVCSKRLSLLEIDAGVVGSLVVEAAQRLRVIYDAQRMGLDLTPVEQSESLMHQASRPESSARPGQAFGLSGEERKCVELRAMSMAIEWLTQNGYSVKDQSAKESYDILATSSCEKLKIEVKGTTSLGAQSILMTKNEVLLHKQEVGQTGLIVVSNISLTGVGDGLAAMGGNLEAFLHWDIDEWELEAIAYRVSRGPNDDRVDH